MIIRPFQAVFPNFDYVTSADAFFDRVKYEYPEFKKNDFFHKAAQEALYIYQIENPQRTYNGLIACVDIQEYLNGNIKKHENTLAVKEQQQMQLMLSRGAIVKPVLLTYHNVSKIEQQLEVAKKDLPLLFETTFASDKTTHRFWEVKDGEQIQRLQELFEQEVAKTYIADGHHRTSTFALMYERMKTKGEAAPYSHLLSAFFPVSELEIHDFNRVVSALDDISLTNFMARLSSLFDIDILKDIRKPQAKHELVMFLNRECYSLRWKASILAEYADQEVVLDANLLNEKVLDNILGITDTRSDDRITYVEGRKGIDTVRIKTNKRENRVGFCLYPVDLSDLITVADRGEAMPPKSTWFEPRIKNGVIVQEI